MIKRIKAFLTEKIFLTKGQVIDLGSLYMLEEEIVRLNHVIGGLKASFTKQDKKCAECEFKQVNAATGTIDISINRDPSDNEIDSDRGVV
jgi:hypothetical protein